jgi:hypothetical protein
MANNWKTPTHFDLKSLLKNNIFGFDKEPGAVLITAFSLCVALCDQLDPLVIWEELKFDDLRQRNLIPRDFFEIIESGEFDNHFNLVIGNPPFESKLTTKSAERIEKGMARTRPKVPDSQLALLFLEQAFRVCMNGGTVCLIQPAGPLLYNGTGQSFREYLFNHFQFNGVFDFTALEGVLFAKAQVAAAAIIGRKSPVSSDKVLHITFRRTRAIKEKLLFELDPYDFHWVDRKTVSQRRRSVWKVNLLGGGRLHRLLERFSVVPTLGEYLKQKRAKEGWQFSEGYSVGCGSYLNQAPNAKQLLELNPDERKQLFKLERTPEEAPWITGKPNVPSKALTQKGIDRKAVTICEDIFFEEPRSNIRAIFSPPHVLIREKLDGLAIPAVFSDEELVFTNQVVGIYAPKNDEVQLRSIAKRLNETDLYGVFAILLSSRILVSRSNSLYQSDFLALPYPEDGRGVDLNFWEKALVEDIGDFLVEFRRRGEEASVLSVVNDLDLTRFGEFFCRVLNPVYEKFRPLDPIFFGSFICFPFCYGDAPEIEIPDASDVPSFLDQLLQKQIGSRLFMNRILRMYEQNVILMIKPNQKRYWLRSIALRDADETLIDLLEQGY